MLATATMRHQSRPSLNSSLQTNKDAIRSVVVICLMVSFMGQGWEFKHLLFLHLNLNRPHEVKKLPQAVVGTLAPCTREMRHQTGSSGHHMRHSHWCTKYFSRLGAVCEISSVTFSPQAGMECAAIQPAWVQRVWSHQLQGEDLAASTWGAWPAHTLARHPCLGGTG